jgi:hypothetical protein
VSASYCYLTRTGRVSGHRREIEIWFEREGDTVYLVRWRDTVLPVAIDLD